MRTPAHILIADDSRTQLELLRHLLMANGHHVRAVTDGAAVLDAAREERPDLIISDVLMPEMDGYQMCAAVKTDESLASIPVILLTTLAEPEDIVRGLNARADYYLTKPYEHEYLLSRVRELLATVPAGSEDEPTVTFDGHSHVIHSSRRQMLNLLISTYESAIQQNRKLGEAQVELRSLYEKLAEDRNLLRTLIDTLPESIFVKDRDGRFILDNRSHMASLGLTSPDQIHGKTVYDFFPQALADAYTADDRDVLTSGQPQINREEEFRDRHGRLRWLATTKMPFRDGAGDWGGLVCASRDITERKQRQQQLADYAEQLRVRNVQMEEDLKMARELQQAFLPPEDYTFPPGCHEHTCAVRMHYQFRPATIIGGDFLDVVPISDSELGVFIGDVMGHGVRPALVTAMVRVLTHELKGSAADPGEFLTGLNRSLCGVLRQAKTPIFTTAFYLILNIAQSEIRYASAGHPTPLQLRADGSIEPMRPAPDARRGTALGVLPESLYSTSTRPILNGDRLILFTDGLFEVEGADGEFFDEQRLLAAVQRAGVRPLTEMFSTLLDEIRTFSITKQFDDDLCLVGLQADRLGGSGDIRDWTTAAAS
jgi:sigma-B regulation protein RsbU (phosphoserine phosphatase)